ncbi:acetolactate synthase, large subunit [Pelosinus fermentans]|uniref:biosynthetic-type acetolactate synthase large subunit n=1 Tax=Pelosinus fermentans TaxID=365349 RepID=UPI0002685888|nr:biosynthetic-type acetolactate synthase large subunit [Pelosinus fermentans]OAM92682.1 acetolactate synthase, large subunit, biosynthetic type [Pelosinus fermentans DSM 17108]SDQ53488.1 acetolactate synthase, large subunit [Pelosinus fermentans]
MKISGAQGIIECLLEQGVDTVFGYPGGRILPLYDAIYEGQIRHILTVHEQGAIHAADGYARASGKVGVCIATSGPGATNLVTGLANAYLDSVPLVVITGQVSTDLIGADAFQEVDITGITMPITKHNFLVKDAAALPEIMRFAFRIASSGRPGPVLIDVPSDIQMALFTFNKEEEQEKNKPRFQWELSELGSSLIDKAVAVLEAAKQPVMIVGGGVVSSGAYEQVVALAEKMNVPVVSTLMGLGSFSSEHPLFLGLTGMHGHKRANLAVHGADVVIAIGSRFNDRVTGNKFKYAEGKTLIHIDVDPAELDKNVSTHIPLAGDVKQLVTTLYERMESLNPCLWWKVIQEWKREFSAKPDGDVLSAPWMLKQVAERTKGKPFLFATDVGQHQMWAAQNLHIETPRSWITSGGLGTMGFGLPAAIGAQIAMPAKRVIAIVGDGGMKMTGCELFTAASQGLPLITIIVDNSSLGMVRQLQQLFYKQRYSESLLPVPMDFVCFAKAFGIEGTLTTTQEEFLAAFSAAVESSCPRVIIVKIPTEQIVTPMLKPNSPLDTFMDI